jgi:hypothetical protein
MASRRSTTSARSAGVGIVKPAPFMWVACPVLSSAIERTNGKTYSETISNMVAASLFLRRD